MRDLLIIPGKLSSASLLLLLSCSSTSPSLSFFFALHCPRFMFPPLSILLLSLRINRDAWSALLCFSSFVVQNPPLPPPFGSLFLFSQPHNLPSLKNQPRSLFLHNPLLLWAWVALAFQWLEAAVQMQPRGAIFFP